MEDYPIKGFVPTSMLDWPGKLVAVIFLSGCNYRCPYCHNASLVRDSDKLENFPFSEIVFFLRERKGWLDGVCITGGEPTLHRSLAEMVERIRSTGMAVKLDTNGSRPGVIKELLEEGLIDFIAMDIKTQLARYPEVVRAPCSVEDIRSSIEEIKRRPVPREFRCTVVPGLVDFADLVGIASLLGEGETLILQQFRPLETLDPAFQRVKPYPDELLTKWSKELSGSLQVRTRGVLKVA